jgi:hypothetical protein
MVRRTVRYYYITEAECDAPDIVFDTPKNEDIPDEEIQGIIEEQNGLPCDVGGKPGDWCQDCYWGSYDVKDDYDEEVDKEDPYYDLY